METRKTNLGVEYELEAYETGRSSVKVFAYFHPTIEFKEFHIKGLTKEQVKLVDETDDVSFLTDNQLTQAQKFINEQAIMYVSMELAKLMGEGRIVSINMGNYGSITCMIVDSKKQYHTANGLPQIEELIKQIRYSK